MAAVDEAAEVAVVGVEAAEAVSCRFEDWVKAATVTGALRDVCVAGAEDTIIAGTLLEPVRARETGEASVSHLKPHDRP